MSAASVIYGSLSYLRMKSRSLSPSCTPLKHRYDSCFNSWFEGYLQPALDSSRSGLTSPSNSSASSSSALSIESAPTEHLSSSSQHNSIRQRPITSWADAFRTRPVVQVDHDPSMEDPSSANYGNESSIIGPNQKPIETAGKTRAQVKAEEYEQACGQSWRIYQVCLKVSISLHPSLMGIRSSLRSESHRI